MNPCPCGYLGAPDRNCTCPETQVRRYRSRLSGPLLDRIDLQVEVARVPYKDLVRMAAPDIPSEKVRERVREARRIQEKRLRKSRVLCNAQMGAGEVAEHCVLDEGGLRLLKAAFERLGLSARSFHRILKISRTIADMDGSPGIRQDHLAEAIQYRMLDRERHNQDP